MTPQEIEKEAEEMYPAPPINKEYIYTEKYLLKRIGYIAGRSKSQERERELEDALQYLVNDVRNKPNDTRYETALKKAENLLNKH